MNDVLPMSPLVILIAVCTVGLLLTFPAGVAMLLRASGRGLLVVTGAAVAFLACAVVAACALSASLR